MEPIGRKYLLMKAVDAGKSPLSGFVRIQRDKQGKTVLFIQLKKRLIQESGPNVYEICLYQQDNKPQWVPIAVLRMDGISEAKEERDVTGYPGSENMALMLYVFRRGESRPMLMAIENESLEEQARLVTRYAEQRHPGEPAENPLPDVIPLPAGTDAEAEKTAAIAGFPEPAIEEKSETYEPEAPAAEPAIPAQAPSEPPEEKPIQSVRAASVPVREETPETPTPEETPKTYWGSTREFYLGLFSQGQSCKPFAGMFPDTEWVVIQPQNRDPYYGAFDHYLVGLTRKDKKVVTIIYAVPGGMYWMPPAPGYGFSRFIPVDSCNGMGYWLCFLDAETGKASW